MQKDKQMRLYVDKQIYVDLYGVIGVDPDVDKSGYCRLGGDMKIEETGCFDMYDICLKIRTEQANAKALDKTLVVVVEAGWMNHTNFHVKARDNAWKAAKIGNHVGANHEVGRQIIKFCKRIGVDVIEYVPKRSKMDAREFREVSGTTMRTNQEVRDAYRAALSVIDF